IKLLEDWTRLHPLLTKSSVHEVFMEKEESYIVLIDKKFYGAFKRKWRGVRNVYVSMSKL
ncbi:hypothetical protein, partial [Clostridium perfringens]|uniref:hypothetical protein n=1 Tax=Clostridium perfringens TaxID=1502 RepID=UPI0039E7D3C7